MRPINKIVVHCSATKPDRNIGEAEITQWHKEKGWSDIGYHFVIRRNGLRENGRPLEIAGAHVAGHNTGSIGICMVGGVGPDGKAECNFTFRQFQTLETLLRELLTQFPKAEVLGHRDLSPDKDGDGTIEQSEWLKECPTFDAKVFLA